MIFQRFTMIVFGCSGSSTRRRTRGTMQGSLRVRCSLGELLEGKCSGKERNKRTWVYSHLPTSGFVGDIEISAEERECSHGLYYQELHRHANNVDITNYSL